ncbi:MAG TPA: serine hydrolase [Gemmatimonadales bacterium]|nr:serine hydrolase [Gemmatimonadales bacterium]
MRKALFAVPAGLTLLVSSLTAQIPATLRARLEARIDSTASTGVGLYYQDLMTGDTLSIDGRLRFHAASTMKLPVMIQLFRDRDAGTLSLSDSLMVHDTFPSLVDGSPFTVDKSDDSDSTLYQLVGHRVPVRHLLELMETVSSNLATDVLIERIGAKRANATAHELGADSILVLRGVEDGKAYRAGLNNTTTARDLGVLLAALVNHRAASASACDSMLAILSRQHFTEGIPSGLPAGAKVYHKTGWIESVVYHDAGIVTLPNGRRYVLVVLTGGIKRDADAYRLVADLSRIIAG